MYVADYQNNRVLIWNTPPLNNRTPADVVIGQTSPSANVATCNNTNLYNPSGVYSDGIKLFVADTNHHRVLVWNTVPTSNGTPADIVIGQTSFTACAVNQTGDTYEANSGSLYSPSGVTVFNGKLQIADTNNNRILIYNSIPTNNGAQADVLIGQDEFEFTR